LTWKNINRRLVQSPNLLLCGGYHYNSCKNTHQDCHYGSRCVPGVDIVCRVYVRQNSWINWSLKSLV